MNRRRFFREGLRELLKPLAKSVEPIERAAHQLGALENVVSAPQGKKPATPGAAPAGSAPVEGAMGAGAPMETGGRALERFLRPPGALEEMKFRETCSRCGTCVSVCPVQAIKIDPTGRVANGAPYIDPGVMPCVACDGLYCMNSCPSGALVPTPLTKIDLGTAAWMEDSCLRTHGQNCTVCVDECPLGTAAIDIAGSRVVVKEAGCIGCGVCEHRCPTAPKSIEIVPKTARRV